MWQHSVWQGAGQTWQLRDRRGRVLDTGGKPPNDHSVRQLPWWQPSQSILCHWGRCWAELNPPPGRGRSAETTSGKHLRPVLEVEVVILARYSLENQNVTHGKLGQNVSPSSDSNPNDALKPENIIDPSEVAFRKINKASTCGICEEAVWIQEVLCQCLYHFAKRYCWQHRLILLMPVQNKVLCISAVSGTDCPGQNYILLARDTMTRCSLPCKRRRVRCFGEKVANKHEECWLVFWILNKVQMRKMEQILAVMCICLRYV